MPKPRRMEKITRIGINRPLSRGAKRRYNLCAHGAFCTHLSLGREHRHMSWFRWLRGKNRQTVTATAGSRPGTTGAQRGSGGEQYEVYGERRHLADAPYVLPSDDQEITRLDFPHFMLPYTLPGNYAAPVVSPHTILDVGAGTGRWAMEMARSEEHTSELQSHSDLVCRLLLEKKKTTANRPWTKTSQKIKAQATAQ